MSFYNCFALGSRWTEGRSWTDEKRKAQNNVVKVLLVSIQAPPHVQKVD
jgi:hypothetical protein